MEICRLPIRFKWIHFFFWVILGIAFETHSGFAALTNPQPLRSAPSTQEAFSVLIDAEKEIRCDDLKHTCTASQNVRVQRGDMVLFSDTLSAHFSKPLSEPDRELTHLIAKGKMRFETSQGKGVAEEALYDVPKEILRLRGKEVQLLTASENLKAQKIQYQQQKRQVLATGNAFFTQKGKVIKAKTLTAFFKPKPAKIPLGPSFAPGEAWELDKVVAQDHVVVSTEDYLAEGDWGQYDAATQKAVLKGHVTLLQGDNLVKGSHMRIDFKKRTAVMGADSKTGSPASGGRIRAMLKPKAKSTQKLKGAP
ncbi:MAG: LptA/OstA family protein [Alphaproteobacteria bacterium]